MKLYYSPGTCSIGIHVLLEEIGKPYELSKLDFTRSEQLSPEFKCVNAKSKVPTLVRSDGTVFTEFPAIAYWLAETNPEKELLPLDWTQRMKCMSMMDYVVGTLHPQGFGRQFRPANFALRPEDNETVKSRGVEIAANCFAIIDKLLDEGTCVAKTFSIADAALFYVEFWQARRLNLKLPEKCAAHYAAMLERPSVRKVLEVEGFV
jgi:glutathione S-transferase